MRTRELPSRAVTFLFADVEGSTRLLQQHGAGYADLLAEHRRALRDAFAKRTEFWLPTRLCNGRLYIRKDRGAPALLGRWVQR